MSNSIETPLGTDPTKDDIIEVSATFYDTGIL